MAEYRIQDTTLTGIAGQIRTLNGTTGTMKPDAMITGLQSANAEVTEQEALLVEIANTLQGKAMPGGGGEDVTAETNQYTSLLDELETAVNALPDAGSGSDGELTACTVGVHDPGLLCYYMYEKTDGTVEGRDVNDGWENYDDFLDTYVNDVSQGSLFTFITSDSLDIDLCNFVNAEVTLHRELNTVGGDVLVVRITGNANISLEY